ncbi:hypothetical protein BH11BAC3_BH11BAC3_47450 [soil metagenome]
MKLYTIALFSMVTIFTSCIGQNNSSIAKVSVNEPAVRISIGETVAELDKSIWYVFQDKKNNYWFGSNGQGFYLPGKY